MAKFSFAAEYVNLRYPKANGNSDTGLRRGQIGAIHALASYFTLHQSPAITVMPTGSGKTAVLMMLPYIQGSTRVLVVTPSRLVRNQIALGFESLSLLRRLEVLPKEAAAPKVCELKERISNAGVWNAMRDFDVVVATPSTISPAFTGISVPPSDLFDLLLIDEAHHSPARTWTAVLEAFPNAKRALFTATPYRRDRKFIKGEIVFDYPLSEARKDHVFGDIRFEPVNPRAGEDVDVAIAGRVEAALVADRAAGLNHSVLIRAETTTRADELLDKYSKNTNLRLKVVHSGHSARRIAQAIKQMKARELDGVVCVNMMGEGFDFPNLKIAGLHSPHRSLGVTLQFIGRFARTGEDGIGGATFFAVPAEIEGETARLFNEEAVWQDLVINLSEGRVSAESQTRARIAHVPPPSIAVENLDELSLHALRPSQHVKVYQVPDDIEPDLSANLALPRPFETVYRRSDEHESFAILIGREQQRPSWSSQLQLGRTEYELVIVYYDKAARLLFINSSRRTDSLYRGLGEQVLGRPPKILPLYKINRCLAGLSQIECTSIGMKNRLHTAHTESYRIIAGRSAGPAVKPSDGRLFHRGHISCRAKEGEAQITLGYSSGSKLWSASKGNLMEVLDWCRSLARKISQATEHVSAPGLDILAVGEPIVSIPSNVLAVDWDRLVYEDPITITIAGESSAAPLLDVSLRLDRAQCTDRRLRVVADLNDHEWELDFDPHAEQMFVQAGGAPLPTIAYGDDSMDLAQFLSEYPLHFYFSDFSRLHGEDWIPCRQPPDSFDAASIRPLTWSNCNIQKEFYRPEDRRDGRLSVQEYLENDLLADSSNTVIFHDHRSGEVADYLTIADEPNRILLTLYHCKKSSAAMPGSGVDQIYDVAGQVIKSVNFLGNEKDLIKHIRRRTRSGSRFCRGSLDDVQEIFRERSKEVQFRIVIVQPGIARNELSEAGAAVLGAADEFVRNAGIQPLMVIASDTVATARRDARVLQV